VAPVLVGGEPAVRERRRALGVSLEGIEVRDPASDPRRKDFEAEYLELRRHKGVTPEVARERVALPHYFAALAVRAGEAAGFVSGLNSETKPFLPAFEIIKMRPGLKRASSVFVMAWEDRVWFYADCSMNIAPDAETLAEIGRASAQSARAFGHEPRVAFLSFSTRDSAKDASIDRVKEAVALVRAAEPELVVDGELQFDAAILPEVAGKKCPDSPLAGPGERVRVPRPQLREHRLQDHRARGRGEGHRTRLPGAQQAGERRLAGLLGAGPRRRGGDHGAAGDGGVGKRGVGAATRSGPEVAPHGLCDRHRGEGCGLGPQDAGAEGGRVEAGRAQALALGRLEAAGGTDEEQEAGGGVDRDRGEGRVARKSRAGRPARRRRVVRSARRASWSGRGAVRRRDRTAPPPPRRRDPIARPATPGAPGGPRRPSGR
jgi:hypothetical protein